MRKVSRLFVEIVMPRHTHTEQIREWLGSTLTLVPTVLRSNCINELRECADERQIAAWKTLIHGVVTGFATFCCCWCCCCHSHHIQLVHYSHFLLTPIFTAARYLLRKMWCRSRLNVFIWTIKCCIVSKVDIGCFVRLWTISNA